MSDGFVNLDNNNKNNIEEDNNIVNILILLSISTGIEQHIMIHQKKAKFKDKSIRH